MRTLRKFGPQAVAVCAFALALSGCGVSSMLLPSTSSKAPVIAANGKFVPRVQDCICIGVNFGTPSEFVCNGKTYTSRELLKLRQDGAGAAMASSK